LLLNTGIDDDNVPNFCEENASVYGASIAHIILPGFPFLIYDHPMGSRYVILASITIRDYEIDDVSEGSKDKTDKVWGKTLSNDDGKFVNVTEAPVIISNKSSFRPCRTLIVMSIMMVGLNVYTSQ